MMRMISSAPSSRMVCATSSSTTPPTKPMVCQRSSPPSTRSCSIRAWGSANTRMASSNRTPCLLSLVLSPRLSLIPFKPDHDPDSITLKMKLCKCNYNYGDPTPSRSAGAPIADIAAKYSKVECGQFRPRRKSQCTKRSGGMMATAVFEPRESRLDRYFFPGLALLMLATVFLGFARSYFLAGVFTARLPNWLIHLHGAAFTSWILLLITQTSLVAANRVDLHRKLGLAGFGLASLMVVLGISASTDSLRRSFGAGVTAAGVMDPRTFYIIPLTDMLIFGMLVFLDRKS